MTDADPDAAAETGDADDEVVFELGDWSPADRVLLQTRLTEQGIAHQWEEGDLVVAEADADAADDAIEAVEYPDELAESQDGADDDGAGYAAMSALFLAADRLREAPGDLVAGGKFDAAADAAAASEPPYGVDPEFWLQVKELASTICAQLDEAEDDVIARDAAALRHLLSGYV